MSVQGEELRTVVADAGSGGRGAVERALDVLWPRIVRYFRARVTDESGATRTAEILAREACLVVAPELSTLARAKHPLRRVYGTLREFAVKSGIEPGGPDSGLLQGLEPLEREVVMLRMIDGLSTYDTAGILGVPVGRVLLVQHEVLKTLRAGPVSGQRVSGLANHSQARGPKRLTRQR
ncbi:MAG: siderophore-interacting protein [Rhodococcus sp.]|nr:siderophore-interacting protein [Rhodococcus sp. (in: high G+C Gram-positive bacteria)]